MLAIGIGVVLVATTVPFLVNKLENNNAISEAQVPWRDAEAVFRGRSLVFVEDSGPYLVHLNPFSANTPDLDGRILYATDRGSENLDLIAARPRRRVYFERTNLTTEETLNNFDLPIPTITVTEMHIQRAPALTLHVRVTNPSDDPIVVAYLKVGQRVEQRTLSTSASKGDAFETEWRVAPPEAALTMDAVPLDSPTRTVVVGAGSGVTPESALTPRQVRDRFSYRIAGTSVEMLTPGRTFTARQKHDKKRFTLHRVTTLPSLSVDVSPATTT